MFRIFLKKKLLGGNKSLPSRPMLMARRNRRIFPRFAVAGHHLKVVQDQEILLIREISAKGFSSKVSSRAFSRMNVGEVFAARMRHDGQYFEMDLKVTWKEPSTVGFELVNASPATLLMMRRLLRPIELANSLHPVTPPQKGKLWWHGDNETDLFITLDEEGKIASWQLRVAKDFVEWEGSKGICTGTHRIKHAMDFSESEAIFAPDHFPHPDRLQFAFDLISAMDNPWQEKLLATISR